eukprot:TRINITY_DN5254_c0_g2_i1.p1 TRINITY_DN5254_c0_g2~~TRINITY_DN5254_c0_g2_i1.p1  ORF type:complete len:752 (+),score=211.02 TRINITY_DN5254_c0_g2_i1:88-2343(+)
MECLGRAARAGYSWMAGLLFTDDDTPMTQVRKASMFMVNLLIVGLCSTSLSLSFVLGEGTVLYYFWCSMAFSSAAVTLVYMVLTRSASDLMMTISVAAMYIEVMIFDVDNAAEMSTARTSSIFVVVVDLLLVGRLPSQIAVCFVAVAILWQAVLESEQVLRYGLLDVPYTTPYHERVDVCNCAHPPCGGNASTGVRTVFAAVLTFVMDFVVTRRFADMVEAERAVMKMAVEVSQEIAGALARFDLLSARGALETGGASLPEELYTSFEVLLGNLAEYKPYLPAALLQDDHAGHGSVCSLPPCGLDGEATELAMMFTDIRSSTMIWGACPDGMRDGLRLHNTCIRASVALHSGYEVKTIGDAFMVAFPNCSDAVRCGLDIQEALLKVAWPDALLKVPQCAGRSSADGVWHGLVVRIGVHAGTVMCEQNTLTGRFDYFGEAVNTAARLEAVCKPGMVAGKPETIKEVVSDGECTVAYRAVLKGLNDNKPVELLAAVPGGLKRRLQLSHADNITSQQPCMTPCSEDLHQPHASLINASTKHTTTAAVQLVHSGDETAAAEGLRDHLATAVLRVQASGGRVVTTVGSRVILSWPGAHFDSALQYVATLTRSASGFRVHSGVTHGPVVLGTAGGGEQRFVTMVGQSMNDAVELSVMAARHGVACLYHAGGDGGAGHLELRNDVRPIPFQPSAVGDGLSQVFELEILHGSASSLSPSISDCDAPTERYLPSGRDDVTGDRHPLLERDVSDAWSGPSH